MNLKHIIPLLLSCLVITFTALAQEQERGQLLELSMMQIAPDKVVQFEEMAKETVALAQQNKIAADYGWNMLSDGFTYILVNRLANMATLDDPMMWMSQFTEENQQKLGEIFQKMDKAGVVQSSNRVLVEQLPSWSYAPKTPGQGGFATVYTFKVKPGHMAAFEALPAEFIKVYQEMNYPYEMDGHRTHFGETNKFDFVFFYDDRSKFMGENDPVQFAQRAGKGEQYQQLLAQLREHIDGMEVRHPVHHPELSYWGPPPTASN